MSVYILDKNGQPLMPTSRVGKVRRLLRDKKAKVVRRCPMTIQLLYEAENHVKPLTHGVDTGSKTIGSAVSDNDGNIYYTAEIEVRNDIKNKMDARRQYRHSRRSRKTRYRKARFHNRRNSIRKDRLNPTMVSKIHAHEKEIAFVASILPIETLVLEMGQFDMAAIKDPSLRSVKKIHWAYQKGPNYGYANTKAMVRARDKYTCQCCGRRNVPFDVHHIIFRSQGGSDDPDNLVTVCKSCHSKIHDGSLIFKAKGKQRGELVHASQMNVIRSQLLKRYPDAIETYGYVTSENRLLLKLPKEHFIDASVIAGSGHSLSFLTDVVYRKRCVSKGDYQKTKGVRSEHSVAPKKILGFRKFDKVCYCRNEYFIKGRMSSGYAMLMNIDGVTQKFTNPKTAKLKCCKRISARKTILISPIYLSAYAIA